MTNKYKHADQIIKEIIENDDQQSVICIANKTSLTMEQAEEVVEAIRCNLVHNIYPDSNVCGNFKDLGQGRYEIKYSYNKDVGISIKRFYIFRSREEGYQVGRYTNNPESYYVVNQPFTTFELAYANVLEELIKLDDESI